jgi:hypothetical protein
MMANYRTLLRRAVKAALLDQTPAGSRVDVMRIRPFAVSEDYPRINLDTQTERVQDEYSGGLTPSYRVDITLDVLCVILATDALWHEAMDTLMDAAWLATQMVEALPWIEQVRYDSATIAVDPQPDQILATATQTWRVTVLTDPELLVPDPDTLPDWLRAYANWDMAEPSLPGGGPDGQIDKYQRINLPQ